MKFERLRLVFSASLSMRSTMVLGMLMEICTFTSDFLIFFLGIVPEAKGN